MKTRYGVSPWVHQFPDSRRPDYPRLKGDHSVDVVIIGGGLTGCAVAYAAASAGLRTILLEADRIGQGSAGRSAGLLLPEPGPLFRDLVQQHGLRSSKRVFEAWRLATLDAAATLKRLKIRCALESIVSLTATGRDTEQLLRREYEARSAAAAPAAWLTAAQLHAITPLEASGGLKTKDAFALDPYRACLGLATAARGRKARLFERSPVRRVTFNRKDAQVTTADAVIRTAHVVVTTGSATREYASLRRHFSRRESYLVLTEPLPATMRKQIGAAGETLRDMRTPRRRLRWTADHRLLIGGGDQDEPADRVRESTRVQRTGQLMYELLTMFPVISGLRPEYGWELGYGDTADGVMYIGPHRNYPHHLFGLGGRSDSITGAFLAARIIARTLLGTPEKDDQVFGFTR